MSPAASLFVLAAVLFLAGSWCVWSISHAPQREPQPSGWDRLDGVATCYLRCSLPGTVLRHERADQGGQWVPVCPGHSDLGDRLGWWADRDLTYSEQRALHDDARRITGEAAGGGRA